MRILSLDLSTSTGWAVLDTETNKLEYGLLLVDKAESFGEYPMNFVRMSEAMGQYVLTVAQKYRPDVIVSEEVNKGYNRYSQKQLEFIHLAVLIALEKGGMPVPKYINTGEWRNRCLGLSVSKSKKLAKGPLKELEQYKKQWELAKKELKGKKKSEKASFKPKVLDLETKYRMLKKDLVNRALFGKIDRKSISVAYVNARWGLDFKKGDNDITDAICLVEAFSMGCKINTNYSVFGHEARDRKKNEQK